MKHNKLKTKTRNKNILKNIFYRIFAPWRIDIPFALSITGWRKFEEDAVAKYPKRYKFAEACQRVEFFLHAYVNPRTWWWKFAHRFVPRHKYHIIRTSLEPNYWDPDTRILYGVMDTFKEFFDHTEKTVDWTATPEHEGVRLKMQQIYNWWVNEFPNREKQLPEFPEIDNEKLFGDDAEDHKNDEDVIKWREVADLHNELEAQWEVEEKEMLIRVIELRSHLWCP